MMIGVLDGDVELASLFGWSSEYKIKSLSLLISLFTRSPILHDVAVFFSSVKYDDKSLSIKLLFQETLMLIMSNSKKKEVKIKIKLDVLISALNILIEEWLCSF